MRLGKLSSVKYRWNKCYLQLFRLAILGRYTRHIDRKTRQETDWQVGCTLGQGILILANSERINLHTTICRRKSNVNANHQWRMSLILHSTSRFVQPPDLDLQFLPATSLLQRSRLPHSRNHILISAFPYSFLTPKNKAIERSLVSNKRKDVIELNAPENLASHFHVDQRFRIPSVTCRPL